MDHTKVYLADLNSARRELFVGAWSWIFRSLFGLLAN